MFYTKYRPQKFSEITKPNQAADALAMQVSSGKTAHAYLFVGPRGIGKTTTARILAKALNCQNLLPTGDPCGQCTFCTQIQDGNFTDLIEIDAASNRGIDDIRSLREKVKLAPVNGKIKVYIIDEVHMLTTEAFNALLKTLEEPPKHVVFILCTTEEHKVPETIKSRCQVFKFSRATVPQLVTKLEKICEEEGVKVFEKAADFAKSKAKRKILHSDLQKLAKNSHGGFRDAETLLEQFIESDGLYLADSQTSPEEFVYLVLSKNQKEALIALSEVYNVGGDLHSFSSNTIYLCRDLLLHLSGVAHVHNSDSVKKLAEITTINDMAVFLNLMLEAHSKVKTAIIPQLPIELAVVQFCAANSGESKKTAPKAKPSTDEDSDFDTELTIEMLKTAKNNSQEKEANEQTKELEEAEEDLSAFATLLEEVMQKWEDIITTVSQINNSVTAILKASKPMKIEGGYLILEVMYKFHKERLESTKNRELVEQAIHTHTPAITSIKCVLTSNAPKTMNKFETGDLTDLNISPVNQPSLNKDNAAGFFDGGLPMA